MKKILIAVTNHGTLTDTSRETGLWLSEFTKFYHKVKNDFEVDIVSPKGGNVPLDPRSFSGLLWSPRLHKYYNDEKFRSWLDNSLSPDQVNPAEYGAIYFTGGHGTMWDFPDSEPLQNIARKIFESGGVVAAVCHGPCALLNLKLANGQFLVEGKEVTGFADREEKTLGLYEKIPYSLEQRLKERGAVFKQATVPFTSKVIRDGRLVTGQNPASVKKVADETIKLLNQLEEKTGSKV